MWLAVAPAWAGHLWAGLERPVAAVQSSGKVLVTVVRDKQIDVARLRRNGKLDRRFGEGGFAETGLGQAALLSDMVVRPSGQIDLAAAFGFSPPFVQSVIQLTKNGELDPGFDSDGVAQPFVGRGVYNLGGLALANDGELLASGQAGFPGCGVYNPASCPPARLIAKLGADGQLDPDFGEDGVASSSLSGQFVDLAVARDGRVVTGTEDRSAQTSYVSRLLPDGSPDPSFSGGEPTVATTPPVDAVAVSESGEIYAGGAVGGDFGVTALKPDGSIDGAFAANGSFATQLGSAGEGFGSLLRASDGDVVLAGPVASKCRRGPECQLSVAAIRLNDGGTPDAGFADDGVAMVPVSGSRSRFGGASVVQVFASQDGLRLVTPVYYGSEPVVPSGVAVVALRDDGSLDPRFSRNGLKLLSSGPR